MNLYAACVLAALHAPADDGERAGLLAEVCETRACVAVVAVLWSLETAQTFALHPRSRGSCGPVQVNPTPRTPTCRELEVPVVGLREGWRIWRLKLKAARGKVARAFVYYNGAAQRERYGRHAMRLLKLTEKCQ